MKIMHICAGWQKWNGAANIARMIMGEQRRDGHSVSFRTWASIRELRTADEVWIHCSWMPCLWWAALWGRNVHWMPECSYDPIRRAYHGWKKVLVGPIERFFLCRAKAIVATCDAEKEWVERYLGKKCPQIEVTDMKRFFDFNRVERVEGERGKSSEFRVQSLKLGDIGEEDINHCCSTSTSNLDSNKLRLLYLGRRHPLKGVEYLETAVKELVVRGQELGCSEEGLSNSKQETSNTKHETRNIELKIVSNAFGEELEKVWKWCDVLVLPTLSDNFGLVVAEALERGKRVITTDGAPVWECSSRSYESKLNSGVGNSVDERDLPVRCSTSTSDFDSNILSGYDGRLLYLKGYRDGRKEKRVELLKRAILVLSRDKMILSSKGV